MAQYLSTVAIAQLFTSKEGTGSTIVSVPSVCLAGLVTRGLGADAEALRVTQMRVT